MGRANRNHSFLSGKVVSETCYASGCSWGSMATGSAADGNSYYKEVISFPARTFSAVSVGATNDVTDTADNYSNSASFLSLLAPGSSIYSASPGGGYSYKSGSQWPHRT